MKTKYQIEQETRAIIWGLEYNDAAGKFDVKGDAKKSANRDTRANIKTHLKVAGMKGHEVYEVLTNPGVVETLQARLHELTSEQSETIDADVS